MKDKLTFNSRIVLIFLLIAPIACNRTIELPAGKWRAVIHTQGEEIPFIMEIIKEENYQVKLVNGEEVIQIDTIFFRGDSIEIPMHIFDASIVAKWDNESLLGYWSKHYLEDYKVKFSASQSDVFRFRVNEPPRFDLAKKYDIQFYNQEDTTRAVGVFSQNVDQVQGTFLTNTGDYRYLVGVASGDSIKLSTFDGSNAYLFKARVEDDHKLKGVFYSGKSGFRHWLGTPDADATIANADTLTKLKEGFDSFSFAMPNLKGDTITEEHPIFDNKVTIVQILGSWCPNCMDETKFLAQWYRKHQEMPVEVVGLAFEYKDDFQYAQKRLQKMVDKLGVDYPILFAGSTDEANKQEKLPMIDRLNAFPSTIFVDKKGKIRKIHTGFSGPGTGQYYEIFVEEFDSFVKKLAEE